MIDNYYRLVSLKDQHPISSADMQRANEASGSVRNLLDEREQYITKHGLDRDVWMPAANWHSQQAFYAYAMQLIRAEPESIRLLRIYSQQFSGYALWCMSRAAGVGFPPPDPAKIEERLRTAAVDEEAVLIWRRYYASLPEYLRISPPAKLGEVGWLVDGILVNHDTAAYWERLHLLYKFGFLDHRSDRRLRAGSRVLEIGGGYGALAWYVQEAVPGVSYTVLDLPESLIYSAIYLNVLHPGQTRFLANYRFRELLSQHEQFDLIINTLSMSEMSTAQVRAYCSGICKLLGQTGFFFEQNQDNRVVGLINAEDIIREYLHEEAAVERLIHGKSHLWKVPNS